MAMFGSSYTKNHQKMVIQECRHRTYNISVDSERGALLGYSNIQDEPLSGCEPLAASASDRECRKKLDEFVEYIESTEPDYVFMFTRYPTSIFYSTFDIFRFFSVADPFEKNNTDLEKDGTYLQMRSQLNKFLPHIKRKLYILDSLPRANAYYIRNIAGDLKKGVPIEVISVGDGGRSFKE